MLILTDKNTRNYQSLRTIVKKNKKKPHHHEVWWQTMQPGPVSGDDEIPSLDQHGHHFLGTVTRHLSHVAPVLVVGQKLQQLLGGGGWC